MSRVLRFRVYSRLYEKYLDTNSKGILSEVHHLALRPDGKLYYADIGIDYPGTLSECPTLEWSKDYEDCIIEQYTGMSDKNGKEIYEGDIVRYSFTNPNRTYTEPVSFGPIQDGEGYYHQEFLAWRTTYVDDGEAHSSLLDLVGPNWTCEIVGNVHENPELLGGGE